MLIKEDGKDTSALSGEASSTTMANHESMETNGIHQQLALPSPPNNNGKTPENHQQPFAFQLSRENIFWTGVVIFVVTPLVLGTITVLFAGLMVVVCSPVWIPMAILFSPVLLLTSPLWITTTFFLVLFIASCILGTSLLLFAIFAFFALPAKYLPLESKLASTFLSLRDQATKSLVKMQAKIVLYTAGVGPIADVALAVVDRIDWAHWQELVTGKEWDTMLEKLQTTTDPKEITGAVVTWVRSILKF